MSNIKNFDPAMYKSIFDGLCDIIEEYITIYGGDIDTVSPLCMEAIEFFLDNTNTKHAIRYFHTSDCRDIAFVSWIEDDTIQNIPLYISKEEVND